MRRHSPPYYSPPRREYGGRPRTPPRRGYGGERGRHKDQNHGSLLVRNIPLDCRPEELRVPFERFGVVRDVYIPKDYYTGQPRGFAFVQFIDAYEAAEAQYHMNGKIFAGREITVVLAAETRKRPEDMRRRTTRTSRGGPVGYGERRSSYYGRSRSRSPPRYASGSRSRYRSRSYSPAPRRQNNYPVSPGRRYTEHPRSPRDHSRERDIVSPDRRYPEHPRSPRDHSRDRDIVSPDRRYPEHLTSPRDLSHDRDNSYGKKPELENEEAEADWRSSPGRASRSPPGSRSRSADISPR